MHLIPDLVAPILEISLIDSVGKIIKIFARKLVIIVLLVIAKDYT